MVGGLTAKAALRDEVLSQLKGDLDVLNRAQASAREAATHEEAKPENDKDTRALEASYLARGQSLRIEELKLGVAEVEALRLRAFESGAPAALGALIEAQEAGVSLCFFLIPSGGGKRVGEGAVQVVTPKSPLGQALLGMREGDDCELLLAGKTRALSISRVW